MPIKSSLLIVVACALLDQDNRVLLTQRPEGKSLAGCGSFLVERLSKVKLRKHRNRELEEELGVHVQADNLFPLTFASHGYETFHLLMPLYFCSHYKGVAQGREGQNLKWVFINDLDKYPMPEADKPLVQVLKNFFI